VAAHDTRTIPETAKVSRFFAPIRNSTGSGYAGTVCAFPHKRI